MQQNQTKILFVTKHVAHAKMAMAGNQIFYHTLLSFCEDSRFECAFVTVRKQSEDFQQMKNAFGQKAKDFSLALPKAMTLFTHLFYHSFLRVFLSCFRADWFLLDPIYRFYFKKAIRNVQNAGFQPEVIVLEWTEVLFLEDFCKKLFPNAKIVTTEHDVSFVKLERRFKNQPKLQKKLVQPFIKKEINVLSKVDLVRVLSKDDRQTLLNHAIAAEKIRLVAPFFQKKNLAAARNIKNQVVFFGALNRSENSEAVQWFIDNVFVSYKLQSLVTFVVVGGGNAQLPKQYQHVEGVLFTGFVEDPAQIFVESLCMVVPLVNGGGIKIKVLEGMTCSLPVLTNEIGMEGIGGKDGVQYIHCQEPKQYEIAIKTLLEKTALRIEIGNHAREWINEHFDYQKDLERYKTELFHLSNRGVS